MNNKKIKTLIALAITTSVIAGANLNTTVASAHTKDVSINSENAYNGKGVAASVYEKLLQKGWQKESDDTLTFAHKAFKFRNLKGINGKDASIIINCDDPEYDNDVFELLKLMIDEESSLTAEKLGRIIGNGTGTIKDGSRFINIQYDGDVDYTITVTFYNYGYTPSYIMPSFDNYEAISTLENLINTEVLSIPDLYNSTKHNTKIIWGGSEKSPIKLLVNSSSNAADLTNSLESLSKDINSMQIIEENDDKIIIELKVKLETNLYNGKYNKLLYFNLEVDKSNTYSIELLNNFMNNLEKEQDNNGSTVTPPAVDTGDQEDTTTTPSEDDNSQKDDETVDSGDSSDNTNPELPPVVDNEDNDSTVTPPAVDTGDQEDTTTTPSEDDNSQKDDETVDNGDSSDDTKIDIPYIGEMTNVINNAITEGTISLDNNDTESNSIIKVNINNVELLKVQALFDSFSTIAKDVKITTNDNYTTITFKVKKESNPLLRESNEYVDIVLNIKNEYTDVIDIANNFVKKLVSSDNSSTIENDNIDNNEVELNTDNKLEANTTTNTVASNANTQTSTSTTTLNKIKELPKTGTISSLPLIGTLTIALGSLLRRNKK